MKIRFNKVKYENLEQIMNWRMDPEVSKYMYTDPELTMEKQIKWYNEKIKNSKFEKYWLIEVNGQNVGLVSLYNIDPLNKRSYWAYYLADKSIRGRGVGKQVELNILDYVFNKMKFNKLCCEVFVSNDSVIKIHEKFGSKVEGVLRQHIYKKGEYHDVVTMGILGSEWLDIKDKFEKIKIYIEE